MTGCVPCYPPSLNQEGLHTFRVLFTVVVQLNDLKFLKTVLICGVRDRRL